MKKIGAGGKESWNLSDRMIRRDVGLFCALVLGAVLLVMLTRPLPKRDETEPSAGVRVKPELPGLVSATVPADQSLLLGRVAEATPMTDTWDRTVEVLGPSLLAVESWSGIKAAGAAPVLRGCGIYVGNRGEAVLPYELVAGGRVLRVMGSDGVMRAGVALAADRLHGLALMRVKDHAGVPVRWASGVQRSARVLVASRAVGQPDRFGFGFWTLSGRIDVVVDVGGQSEEAVVVGSALREVPGAPVVNAAGEVVGVLKFNAQVLASSNEFAAVPARVARASVQAMLAGMSLTRPYLGLAVQSVDGDLAQALGLAEVRGAVVSDVFPGGPAAEAGIIPGDVLVRVGDFSVHNHLELRSLVGRMPGDQPMQLEVVRAGEVIKLQVKAGVSESLDVLAPPPPSVAEGESLLTALEVGPGPQGHPVVKAWYPQWVVATRSLAVGDRIMEINGQPVLSVADFQALRERTRGMDWLLLRIEDGGGLRRYLVLKRP